MDSIEVVLCACGCGEPAPIAKETRPERGHVKGKPITFINHHNKKRLVNTELFKCATCKELKSSSSYHTAKNKPYGIESSCKDCRKLIQIKSIYGLTAKQYGALVKSNDTCPICGCVLDYSGNKTRRSAHIDHDHKTGDVRGILCGRCNRGIGMFDDDVDALKKAIEYLEKANG